LPEEVLFLQLLMLDVNFCVIQAGFGLIDGDDDGDVDVVEAK
jgi:hypothetical protein